MNTKFTNVEEYIRSFGPSIQVVLREIYETIAMTAPDAIAIISYGMPAFKYKDKPLVYFGGFAKHIGFYATPGTHEDFKARLAIYKQGKGSVQFPLDQPMPLKLIEDMVRFRMDLISNSYRGK